MAQELDKALNEFKADDLTPKMIRTVFKVIPFAPEMPHFGNVEEAAKALRPGIAPMDINRVRGAAENDAIKDILWMAKIMDMGDKGYAVVTGLQTAFALFKKKKDALELDPQQRNDAILKAIGLAYMVFKAYPGGVGEKVEAFRTSDAGKALATYYGALEVALPFADNAAVSGGSFLKGLFDKGASEQVTRLGSMTGGKSISEATGMLTALTDPLQRVVSQATKYTGPVAETASKYLPGAMAGMDKAAGVAANVVDVMPVYRYLGARLAAEAAVRRAFPNG